MRVMVRTRDEPLVVERLAAGLESDFSGCFSLTTTGQLALGGPGSLFPPNPCRSKRVNNSVHFSLALHRSAMTVI